MWMLGEEREMGTAGFSGRLQDQLYAIRRRPPSSSSSLPPRSVCYVSVRSMIFPSSKRFNEYPSGANPFCTQAVAISDVSWQATAAKATPVAACVYSYEWRPTSACAIGDMMQPGDKMDGCSSIDETGGAVRH